MKRRIEKLIQKRMASHNETYPVAKLIVLQQERASKVQFRTTIATANKVPSPNSPS